MNRKKIIKNLVKLAAVSAVGFIAYEVGKMNGEQKEHKRMLERYENTEYDDDDYDFDFDEPDDGCLAPAKRVFASLDSVYVSGLSSEEIRTVVYNISFKKHISVRTVMDILDEDSAKAAEVILALMNAGYIGQECGSLFPVYITFHDYYELRKGDEN